MGDEPAPTAPSGPTDHLDTVDYWRDLYKEAIDVGGDMLNERRAEIDSLRATLAEKDRRIGELERVAEAARAVRRFNEAPQRLALWDELAALDQGGTANG